MTRTKTVWTANVLTLFPEMFPGPLAYSIAGKALREEVWSLQTVNIRSFANEKHKIVDDSPFGGGAGMVMRPDIIDRALEHVSKSLGEVFLPILYLTPRGLPLTQSKIKCLCSGSGVILVCGRYEGIDQRAIDAWKMEEVNLGDFVMSGGEPGAISLIDACVRLLPGVMGSELSREEESFEKDLLEYPHYTRPRRWQKRIVPDVLLSGDHKKIRAWRQAEAEKITRKRRPDLWDRYAATRD